MGLRLLKNKSWQLIELSHQISVPLELEAASLKTPSVSAGAQLPSWEETGVSVSEGNWVLTGHSRTIWKTAQTVYNSVPEKSPVQLWLSDSCGDQGTNLQAICFGEQLVNRIEKKKKKNGLCYSLDLDEPVSWLAICATHSSTPRTQQNSWDNANSCIIFLCHGNISINQAV